MSRRLKFYSFVWLLVAAIVASSPSFADPLHSSSKESRGVEVNALIVEIFGDQNSDTIAMEAPPVEDQDDFARELLLVEHIRLAQVSRSNTQIRDCVWREGNKAASEKDTQSDWVEDADDAKKVHNGDCD